MRAKLVDKNKNEFEFNYCNYILFVVVVIFSSYCSFLSYVLFLFLPIFLFGFSFCFSHAESVGFLSGKFNQLVYNYPIRIPERFSLVIRSLLTQEGICFTLQRDFKFLEVIYFSFSLDFNSIYLLYMEDGFLLSPFLDI